MFNIYEDNISLKEAYVACKVKKDGIRRVQMQHVQVARPRTSLHLKYNVYTSLEQDAPPHVLHGMYCLTWLFHVNLSWKGDEVSVFDHNSHTKFARPILMKYNIIILHWYKQMVDSINLMLLQFQD